LELDKRRNIKIVIPNKSDEPLLQPNQSVSIYVPTVIYLSTTILLELYGRSIHNPNIASSGQLH
jgi:hypothetical protein